MMYERVVSYVRNTPWAMLESKIEEVLAVLAFRAAGHQFSAEELRARIGDGSQPPDATKRGSIAVIPLRGVIAHRMGTMDESSGGMSAERFTRMVQAAAADESIGAIVLDVDSPGGAIPGLMEAADAVFAAREKKTVIAVANSTMASAAYWIASQASEIVAIPSALDRCIGSIGVFCVSLDMTEKLAKEGIKATVIKAGANKAEGNPFESPSEEYLAALKAGAEAAKKQFVKAVARGRGITPAAVVSDYGDGRAFSAPDAKAAGLVDRIATMDDVIAKLAGRKSVGGGMRAEDETPALAAADADLARRLLL
jgi:signal peptide peptidase SppA